MQLPGYLDAEATDVVSLAYPQVENLASAGRLGDFFLRNTTKSEDEPLTWPCPLASREKAAKATVFARRPSRASHRYIHQAGNR